ncbi:MAG TPA: hypothetical protein VGL72_17370 [Bryobacteraceae bacterium]|jgi:hypothetical protein
MRSLQLFLLAAAIGVVGIALWQRQTLFGDALHAASAVISPVSSKTYRQARAVPSGTAKHSVLTKKSAAGGASRTNPTAASNELSGISVPAELNLGTTVVKPLLDVPDSEKMEIGAGSSELRQRFGTPTLAVESVNDGSLVERYYYVKPDRNNLVIATLREGKLISAQTAQVWRPQPRNAAQ